MGSLCLRAIAIWPRCPRKHLDHPAFFLLDPEFSRQRREAFVQKARRAWFTHWGFECLLRFFSFLIATFLLVGTLAIEIYNSRRVRLVAAGKEFGCHLTFILPSLVHVALDRLHGNVSPIQRSVAESLKFAGDLRNVFIPFGLPQVFSDTLTLRQEYEWSPVSVLTVIGIILMLLMFSSGDDRIGIIRTVLLVGILFFTAGGLGVVFADVIFPGYRAWARLTPFIVVAAHLGLGLVLKKTNCHSSA